MQHHTGADIWTNPACGCKPSSLRGCAKSVQASQPRARAAPCAAHCESREPSGYREKPPFSGGQKFRNSNAGKALQHYGTRIYVTTYRPAGTLNLIFSKLEIIIKVSVNGYIPMNYIAAVQLIPGLVDFQIYCFNILIFNILNIVETAGLAAVSRDLPSGTDETGKRIVKPYKNH